MKWKIHPKKSDDLFEQLLLNRGIKTEKEKELFFSPRLLDYEKSLNIKGIPNTKNRIEKAIQNGELIIVYGDYDVDGITASAILYLGLTLIGAKVLPYIPHREKEGYGLSNLGLEFARDSGASLVISVDCGIVNFEEAKFAKELGLDLIITDHHQTLNKIPDCFEIVHSIEICGSGIAWALLRSLAKDAENLLDLVAIATVADMMPLLGINRAFVKRGLEILNRTKRVGFLALFEEAGVETVAIDTYTIGHVIAPRLNAMGRLEHAIDSLRLICTKDPIKAKKLADLVGLTNSQRKELTIKAYEDAKVLINGSSKRVHVISPKDWVPGIVGLIAGRICEETRVSAIAISEGEIYSKGSARAYGNVNIVETLRKCSDILVAVGGHKGAAGFTIETTKIQEFRERLEKELDGTMIDKEPELEIEAEIQTNLLNLNTYKKLSDFEDRKS